MTTPVTIGLATDLLGEPQLARNQPVGLGTAIAGGGDKAKRRANDYYPTPPEATHALLIAEKPFCLHRGAVWEPCGRGGAIKRVLDQHDIISVCTDIVADPDNEVSQLDLLAAKEPLAQGVITNMPFALARPMIAHLWTVLKVDYMALLFKAQFLNSGESAKLWRAGMEPTRRWDLTWRLDFTGGGSPTMDCCWLVWDRHDNTQRFGLLDKNGPVGIDRGLFA